MGNGYMYTVKELSFTSRPSTEIVKLFSLRYKVFHSRLNWRLQVDSVSKQEKDQYDTLGTKYIYVTCADDHVVGCWRIIPTTQNYMLRNTFPELLGNEIAPCSTTIYELSRFAVDKQQLPLHSSSSQVTKMMFKAIYYYAKDNGIEEFVTVTSVGVERIVKKNLIPCIRFGSGIVHLLGSTKSVALRIAVDEHFEKAVSV